ncbi:MAG: hypothetical protein KAW09_10070, partial [Thermoplasmata archaeon]|nr:hypothetical protein [Thermoplasmata archaeon]
EELDQVEILGEQLEETSKGKVSRIEVQGWNEAVASALMERLLKELGYKRLRWPSRSFVKYNHFDSVTTDAGMLREHASVRLDFSEMADDRLFIWTETRTSCRKTALDLLTENLPDSTDKVKALDFLSSFKQRIVPSGSIAKAKDIVFGANMDTETIPEIDMTFTDYWKEKKAIPLTQQIQPIVIIQGWNGDLHYPAEMIFVDRHDLEGRIGTFRGRAPRFEDPNLRAKKAEALFNELRSVKVENSLMKFLSADFESCCPLVSEVSSQGVFSKIVRISPPLLEFARNSLSLDPMDVFAREFGPICGRKDIILSHVICPDDVGSHDLDSASEAIGRIYSSSNFGRLKKGDEPIIVKYDINEGMGGMEAKIRRLDKLTDPEKSVCLAVIPKDGEFYYAVKKLLPGRVGIPVQGLRLETLSELARGRFKGGGFLSLQLLIKSLNRGECVWRLASAAGLSKEKVLYTGIGFSRTPGIRRVGKCAAVMHDAHGSGVTWSIFATPMVERTIIKQWFDTVLFRIRDIVQKENPERVTFYRHGSMYPIEAEAIETSIRDCSWLSSTRVTFVSVIDEGRRRFYIDNWKRSNLPPGTAFVLNEKEALLSTSNYDGRELMQGTVIPIRLVKEFGEEDMVSVLKEYHDQTYLSWAAPKTTSKYPLVLTIANRFAQLTRENIPLESMFYLDM